MVSDLEEIKRHPSLIQLFTQRIKLTRRGREMEANCPFHKDRTPSFQCFEKDGVLMYFCQGCGAKGNAIQFVENFDKISFKAALELARKHINESWSSQGEKVSSVFHPVSQEESKVQKTYSEEEYRKLENALANCPEAQSYLLSERGISYETAKRLRLGYRQDVGRLAGTANSDVADSGWISLPTFGLHSSGQYEGVVGNGHVTSVKYRSIVRKAFTKQPGMGTYLFNLETVDFLEPVYLVEGELDAAVLEQAGFRAVSLPNATTQVTPEWKDALLKADCVILAGDNDNAAGTKLMAKLFKEMPRTYWLKWPGQCKDANQFFLENCKRDSGLFTKRIEELTAEARSNPVEGIYDIKQSLLTATHSGSDNPDRLRFPWPSIDNMAIITPGTVTTIYSTESGQGKELAIDTPVLTPHGPVRIDYLVIGDQVIGANGKPTMVTGVFPQGIKPAFKMSFTDGTSVVCGSEHLWAVRSSDMTYRNRPHRVLSTKQLIDGKPLKGPCCGYRHHIPIVDPIQFSLGGGPLKPYLLGALLGDGGFTTSSVTFTNTDTHILERVASELPAGVVLKPRKKEHIQYTLYGQHRHPNPVIYALKELGLWGLKSADKFIPLSYKYSDIESRKALLQGLLDTDGCAPKKNAAQFCSISRQLVEDVIFLVRSLGGFAKNPFVQTRDDGRAPLYNAYLSLPDSVSPFHVQRKANTHEGKRQLDITKSIVSIEPVAAQEMFCISVQAKDGLYVLGDTTVTHNTTFVLQASLDAAMKSNEVVVNYQAEMMMPQIHTLVASYLLRKDRLTLTEEDFKRASAMIGSDVKYYVGRSTSLTTVNEVLDLLELAIKRFGATIAILDNLHFLCRNESDQIKAQANAMQRITNLAGTYGLKFILVHQARKADQNHKRKVTHVSDLDGSKAVQNDSSFVFSLHRDEIKHSRTDETENSNEYDPLTEIRLQKAREKGPGGSYAKLIFLGSICAFAEVSGAEEPTMFG